MKILLLSDSYSPIVNGVVSSVTTLRRSLLAQNHDVRVLACGDRRGASFDGDVYRLPSIGLNAIYPDLRLARPMDRKVLGSIIQWGPDVVHSHTEFVAFFWARKLADQLASPHVHTYHTVYEDYTHYFFPSRVWGRRFVSRLSRRVLERTDLAIAPTRKVEALLTDYGVTTPIRVIPTGVDLTRFAPASGEARLRLAPLHGAPRPGDARRPGRRAMRAEPAASCSRPDLRRRLGIPDDEPVILFVGRLAQEKNLTETVTLLSRLPRGLRWRCVVVGDGPQAAHLRHLVFKLGLGERVLFTGGVDPAVVGDYYRLGDVFVSSSVSETQGLTYLEALASGLPLLCRADPALDDVVVDDVNGYTYSTPEQFLASMSALLGSPGLRARLAEQARPSVLAHSENQFAYSVVSAYEDAWTTRHRRLRIGRAA